MKKIVSITCFALALILQSCVSNDKQTSDALYNTTWELEFLAETNFQEAFPNKKPYLTFNKETQQVAGNNSCNGYTAPYKLTETTITFGTPGPTTMMYCGEGERLFLNAMKKVNAFSFDLEGKLTLMANEAPLLRFKAIDPAAKETPNTKNTTSSNSLSEENKATDVYFKANGTEPFWQLSITDKIIKLKMPNDSILTPHATPDYAQDSNVKRYALQTELAEVYIQISQKDCNNSMSGKTFPYSVSIDYKKGKATQFTKLEGCGQYITNYRLHDIWVLETLNGQAVTKEAFGKTLPSMEINANENLFMGLTGCNTFKGKLFSERNKLRFTNIAITKKMCLPDNKKEQEFILALERTTTYSIGNNRLTLSNPDNELLVFKKVD